MSKKDEILELTDSQKKFRTRLVIAVLAIFAIIMLISL